MCFALTAHLYLTQWVWTAMTKTGYLGVRLLFKKKNSYTSFKAPSSIPSGHLPNPPMKKNPTSLTLSTWAGSNSAALSCPLSQEHHEAIAWF